nr:MAG TPA: hypothetical protein [Caudoviricetes sp.]
MATYQFKGLEEYALKLSKLRDGSREVAGKAIYAGAKIVADAVRENIKSLPVRRSGYGTTENPLSGITQVQKKGLMDGFGISPLSEDNGYYNVKLGFDGYNDTLTDKYPGGQPNQLVARGVESGTSWLKKMPFVAPAVKNKKKQAVQEMQRVIDEETSKITE